MLEYSNLTYSFNSLQLLWKHLCVAQGRGAFKRMNRFEPPFIIRIRPQSYTGYNADQKVEKNFMNLKEINNIFWEIIV